MAQIVSNIVRMRCSLEEYFDDVMCLHQTRLLLNELDIMKLFRGAEFEDASEELCGCQILVVDPAGNPVHFDSSLSLVVFTIQWA